MSSIVAQSEDAVDGEPPHEHWGRPIGQLRQGSYPDHYWRQAYEMAETAAGSEYILAPEPLGKPNIIAYDEVTQDKPIGVIVLAKDFVNGLPRYYVTRLCDYETIFENEVFLFYNTCNPLGCDTIRKWQPGIFQRL